MSRCRTILHWLILILLFNSSVLYAKRTTFRAYGDTFQIIIPVSALIITIANQDHVGFWQLARSFTATMVITNMLKFTIKQPRPSGNGKHSFPSGHTSSAFAGAAYLNQRYGWPYGIPAYTMATAVGTSRIHAKAHRWSEIIVGAGIGILTNRYFTTKYTKPLINNEFNDKSTSAINYD